MKTNLKLHLQDVSKQLCIIVNSTLSTLIQKSLMTYVKAQTFCLVFFFLVPDLMSQSLSNEEILHDRYWSYRERFRKYFTVVGKEAGNGLPFSNP